MENIIGSYLFKYIYNFICKIFFFKLKFYLLVCFGLNYKYGWIRENFNNIEIKGLGF